MISEHLTGQEIIDLRLLHSFIGSPTLYSLILDIKVNFLTLKKTWTDFQDPQIK